MQEFLAAQIANRIKIDFREDEKFAALYDFQSVEGSFAPVRGDDAFIIKFKIFDKGQPDEQPELRTKKIEKIMQITNTVVKGYQFKGFGMVEMEDQIENIKLWATAEDVGNYNNGRVPISSIIKTSGEYF